MWPTMDEERRDIWGFSYNLEYVNEKASDAWIKEIVMIYADFTQVEFSKEEVPLVVSYDTDFGIHVILFSKVRNTAFINEGTDWTATFRQDDHSKLGVIEDDGRYINEDILNDMYKKVLSYVKPN